MRASLGPFLVLFVSLHGVAAGAEPAKKTAVPCTIGGRPIALGGMHSELVATPTGRLVVLAGDGTLHAYRPHAGAACTLDVDRSFGRGGVLDSGIGANFISASLSVDSRGTLYVDRGSAQVVVKAGRVSKMCGDDLVAASVRSQYVWRWSSLSDVSRETNSCTDATHVRFIADMDHFMGSLFPIDDRVVVDDGHEIRLYASDHKSHVTLENDRGSGNLGAVQFVECGEAICALGDAGLVVWNTQGHELATVDLESLLELETSIYWRGFAMQGQSGYGLGVHDDKTVIYRFDGITTWPATN